MKKYVILLLCLAVALMLAACEKPAPTTTGGDPVPSNPSSSVQQDPTEPTKPNDGMVDPEDPSLSAYEKEFYQRFNEGQKVELFLEEMSIALSIHSQTGKLLAKISRGDSEDMLPTLEGDCEGNFQYEFQMLYESDIVDGENGTVTCRLQDNKMFLKRSGDFTDEIAQKYLEYMKSTWMSQEKKDDLATILSGEPVEGYNMLGADASLVFSAKVNDGNYTDIRVDCYDGEEIEYYFLVLEDMVQAIEEREDSLHMIAYAFDGRKLYEEYHQGEQNMRVDYTYDDAGRMIRTEYTQAGEALAWMDYVYDDAGRLIKVEGQQMGGAKMMEEYAYDEEGNKTSALHYQNGILVGRVEYNAKGDEVTDLEYDENGNITWGYESIFDDAGKLKQKTHYWSDGSKEISKYDEAGNETSHATYDAEGIFQSGYEYVYDDAGNKVQQTHRYQNGAYYVEIFNAKGQTISWMDYNAEGKLTSGYEYIFDDEGKLLKSVDYQGDARREMVFDKNDKVVSNYLYVQDKAVEWELSTYNEAGQLLTFIRYDDDNYSGETRLDRKLVYAYNEDGLLISMDTYFSEDAQTPSFRDVYTYDEAGRQKLHYMYNSDGTLNRWDEYTYNAAGQPLTWIHYKGEGTDAVERREEWEYNAVGECVSNLAYDGKGELLMGFKKEYGANGKVIRVENYDQWNYEVTEYNEDHTYATRHVYDRNTNELKYWVELIIEGDTLVDEIYHYPE